MNLHHNNYYKVRSEVFTAVLLNIQQFWDVTPCWLTCNLTESWIFNKYDTWKTPGLQQYPGLEEQDLLRSCMNLRAVKQKNPGDRRGVRCPQVENHESAISDILWQLSNRDSHVMVWWGQAVRSNLVRCLCFLILLSPLTPLLHYRVHLRRWQTLNPHNAPLLSMWELPARILARDWIF
jgi:hypothetical protein